MSEALTKSNLFEASAPSNIALIKYMGKFESTGNRPTNASVSLTLPHLLTKVQIEKTEGSEDRWEALDTPGFVAPELSEKGREKFLKHFAMLKKNWSADGAYVIRSANNFPSDCGLASSASSFAALTKAAAAAFQPNASADELSKLSRQGSGSSCRSLFAPWAVWKDEGAQPIDLGYEQLDHVSVIVSAGIKEVSSSEAHKRVTTSPKFQGRPQRAEDRLRQLVSAMKEKNWKQAYELCWDEFIDMHELFETSEPPFKYRTAKSATVVDAAKHIWNYKGDGPLVTMDAGPNVHLIFRPDQRELAEKMVAHYRNFHIVMTSWGGLK